MNTTDLKIPYILKTNSSFGNWVVKYTEVNFRWFWKKSDAQKWLAEYLKNVKGDS